MTTLTATIRSNEAKVENPSAAWQSLYKLAGAAALLAILVAVTDISLTFLPAGAEPPGTMTAVDWFDLFHENWFMGLRNLGLLPNILTLCLLIPLYLALYGIHRHVNKPYAILALALLLLGVGIYLSNNAAFPMWALSARYAAAATEAQRTLIAAAGEAVLARGEDFTPGAFMGFLFSEAAALLISCVMLRGGIFSKATAWAGILAGACLTVFTIWGTFIPGSFELAMLLAGIGGIASIAWNVLTARRLFQLSKASR
jgi:hypothetical protein